MGEVKVNLGSNSYKIHIGCGLMQQIHLFLDSLNMPNHVFIITDENVGSLYAKQLAADLQRNHYRTVLYCVKPGEQSKSWPVLDCLYTEAVKAGFDRSCTVLAVGGGVVGDLAGFFAATYMRGVPFIQIPTTLLAQVDSSVGGKVAINHVLGKNIIGAFYQPRMVLIDPTVLTTLPASEISNGLAEVIKYGIIADQDLFAYLIDNVQKIVNINEEVMLRLISKSCSIKARIVEQDEKDTSVRMILNFGHTIGHAVEAVTGYNKYTHGEAVAIGMHGAALLSEKLLHSPAELTKQLLKLLQKINLPVSTSECDADSIVTAIRHDKKSMDGVVNWILLRNIGDAVIHKDVAVDVLQTVLHQICK